MRILFDNGVPDSLRRFLTQHTVVYARQRGWERIANGDLLRAAEREGFDLLISTDAGIVYEQNLPRYGIALLVVHPPNWRVLRLRVAEIGTAVDAMRPGEYRELRLYADDDE